MTEGTITCLEIKNKLEELKAKPSLPILLNLEEKEYPTYDLKVYMAMLASYSWVSFNKIKPKKGKGLTVKSLIDKISAFTVHQNLPAFGEIEGQDFKTRNYLTSGIEVRKSSVLINFVRRVE